MKEERIKTLIRKYNAGETTREEEQFLNDHSELLDAETKTLLTFIEHRKIKPPSNFNDMQWRAFELKQKQRKINRYSFLAVAASILVLVTFLMIKPSTNEMDLAQKQALLHEAIQMTESTQEPNKTILYEDELVIIYTSN